MKARQAKKLLKAISIAHVSQGDTLVVRLRTQDDIFSTEEGLKTLFPNVKLLFIFPGQSLSVIKEDRITISGNPSSLQRFGGP